jgi:crotonobetaine/carnitine-CoA ligase
VGQLGYWRMPEATIDAWRNLWFHTGDLVRQDGDGWYYFLDRSKDAIRRSGENISSFEVEQVLLSHPAVFEAAVYAVPAELSEDEVMVAVVLEEGKAASPEEILAFCENRLAYFAVPRYVDIRASLPKTQTEKVQKQVLRSEGVTASTFDRGPSGRKVREERARLEKSAP